MPPLSESRIIQGNLKLNRAASDTDESDPKQLKNAEPKQVERTYSKEQAFCMKSFGYFNFPKIDAPSKSQTFYTAHH